MQSPDHSPRNAEEELQQALGQPAPSLAAELAAFLVSSRKWWLAPVIVAFLALGLLVLLSSTGAAPFIYTLF